MPIKDRIEFHAETNIGRRDVNQDAVIACSLDESKSIFLFAVADGMGGGAGGEIASRLVLEAVKFYLTKNLVIVDNGSPLKDQLYEAIMFADMEIRKIIDINGNLESMGTTLTCILFQGDSCVIGNIGDSRIYYYNVDRIIQLTRDHSALEDHKKLNKGSASPEAIKNYSHIITRAIKGDGIRPDIYPEDEEHYKVDAGVGFLLVSDGVITDYASDRSDEMLAICNKNETPASVCQGIIDYAYNNLSQDNISCVNIQVNSALLDNGSPSTNAKSSIKRFFSIEYFLMTFILIVAALILYNSGLYQYISKKIIKEPETVLAEFNDKAEAEINIFTNCLPPENDDIPYISNRDLSWDFVSNTKVDYFIIRFYEFVENEDWTISWSDTIPGPVVNYWPISSLPDSLYGRKLKWQVGAALIDSSMYSSEKLSIRVRKTQEPEVLEKQDTISTKKEESDIHISE